MAKTKSNTGQKFITPLNMNSLRGRMLYYPKLKSSSKSNFLIVYGQKSTIEKWITLAAELRNYGNVIMPDLPGLGGMNSFYKINEKPTIDNYADYLAAFIKLKFRRKQLVIVGMSFGFVIVTRMLQKYPEFNDKVNLIINLSGFTNNNDLKISTPKKKQLSAVTKTLSHSSASKIYRAIAYDDKVFLTTKRFKLRANNSNDLNRSLKVDLKIQKKNDTRSHMFILREILKLDLTNEKVNLPIWSIVGEYDEYLNVESVKENLAKIYKSYHEIKLKKHTEHSIKGNLTTEDIASVIPYKLKVLLNRQNKHYK